VNAAFSAGLGLPASVWEPVVRLLPAGADVVLVDRPGLGELREVAPEALVLDREAERIAAAVRKAGAAPAVLVGHSMGGFLLEATARLHPDLATGLVLVDSSVESRPRRAGAVRRAARDVAGGVVERLRLGARAAAIVAEDASYPDLSVELERLRLTHPLPDVPVVLAAARSVWAAGARSWLRDQRWLGEELGADVEVVWGSGHRVMRDAPADVATAIARAGRRPAGVAARAGRLGRAGRRRRAEAGQGRHGRGVGAVGGESARWVVWVAQGLSGAGRDVWITTLATTGCALAERQRQRRRMP
jgi:pimeloyl-ACP methyl ester carboxylesterase